MNSDYTFRMISDTEYVLGGFLALETPAEYEAIFGDIGERVRNLPENERVEVVLDFSTLRFINSLGITRLSRLLAHDLGALKVPCKLVFNKKNATHIRMAGSLRRLSKYVVIDLLASD